MIDIHIMKYRETNGTAKNYFDFPVMVDYLHSDNCLIDGFPVYSEEMDNQENALSVVAGNFTIRFSLLQSDKSQQGKSIKDFFISSPYNNLFVIAINFSGKKIIGKVDLQNIKVDLNQKNDGWFVELNCIGLETEFREYLKGRQLGWNGQSYPEFPDGLRFDDFIESGWFMRLPVYCTRENRLNIEARCGFPVYYGTNAVCKTIEDLYPFLNQWRLLFDLQKGHGISWKLQWTGNIFPQGSNKYPIINFVLFWKTQGINEFTEFQIKKHEEGLVNYFEVKDNLIVDYEFTANIQNNGEGFYHNVLAIKNNGNYWLPIAQLPNGNENMNSFYWTNQNKWDVWDPPKPQLHIQESEISLISLEKANQQVIKTNSQWGTWVAISFSRLVHRANSPIIVCPGLREIVEKTALIEYQFLMKGIKRIKNLKIYMNDITDLELFNKMEIGGKDYWINRIRNLNIMDYESDVELIEI